MEDASSPASPPVPSPPIKVPPIESIPQPKALTAVPASPKLPANFDQLLDQLDGEPGSRDDRAPAPSQPLVAPSFAGPICPLPSSSDSGAPSPPPTRPAVSEPPVEVKADEAGPTVSPMEVDTGGEPSTAKEDFSAFDEPDPSAPKGEPPQGGELPPYTMTPEGEYYDPDSQETFLTLEALMAQRRLSGFRAVRASANESKDPVEGGLQEANQREAEYWGDETSGHKRGSIPLAEAFKEPDMAPPKHGVGILASSTPLDHLRHRRIFTRANSYMPLPPIRRGP